MCKLVLLLLFCLFALGSAGKYFRVCYHTNWAQYRPGRGKFNPEQIDPFLCTHVIYAFAKIGRNHELSMYEWNDDKLYPRAIALKEKNPDLKILLAVGGWNHENGKVSKFSVMVNNEGYLRNFASSTVKFLRHWGFDGLDIDWEYPGGRGNSPPGDKQKYTLLVNTLKDTFEAEQTDKSQLILTAAVSAGFDKMEAGYEIAKIGKRLDILNLMAYDLHGNWEKITGHHCAMADDGGDAAKRKEYTVPYALNLWIEKGFPAHKIALGLATYGRSFRLKDASNHGLAAPKAEWGNPPRGQYTREPGFLSYYEICSAGYTIVEGEDNVAGSPYGYKGTAWVGFENKKSLVNKARNLIKAKGLGGAMFWDLPLDDFSGTFCNEGKYPLINAVKSELENGIAPTPPKPTKSTPSHPPRPTHAPTPPPTHRPHTKGCHAIGSWKGDKGMDEWCRTNCPLGNCPEDICECEA